VLVAYAEYKAVRDKIDIALGPERKPLLIGIDGPCGVGKSSLASWAGWQFGMPAIHLDLFIEQIGEVEGPRPLSWRVGDLNRCVRARGARPFIIEGALLLDVLEQINRKPDFLIVLEPRPKPSTRILRPTMMMI
jgi:hypothetical protein